MPTIPKPNFVDEKVIVRTFASDDAQDLYLAVHESLDELTPWMSWCGENYLPSDATEWIQSRDFAWATGAEYTFAVLDRQTGKFAGTVGLNQINRLHNFANLGFWVRTSLVKNGIATAATRLAARFALQQLGLHRVEILAVTANLASRRVAEKSGARAEGILRKRLVVHEKAYDAALYSLTTDDLA
jgi:RimJ/RimL family protein N-acetyltransferase